MQEIKKIVCDDVDGETLWEGILLPNRNGNYEGYIHSSIVHTHINFEYLGWDAKMTIESKNPASKIIDTSIYDLILVNKLGITEWFTTADKNTIVCTKENVSNVLATTYKKQLENNKLYIR